MRRRQAIAGTNILVQVIHVTWDKSGRGGLAAEHRNQIPLVLPLPSTLVPDIGRHLLIHETHWDYTNNFANATTSKVLAADSEAGFRYSCATVRPVEEGAELEWTWNVWGGMPPRRIRNSDGNTMPATHKRVAHENEWIRARWNGRLTCIDTGTWWYESVAINVGVCSDSEVPTDFFTRSEPCEDYTQMAYLR